MERLAGGDLSTVMLVHRPGAPAVVAKVAVGSEAAMLRAIGERNVPIPTIEVERDGILLLGHVANDGRFDARAWHDIGLHLAKLHAPGHEAYGWYQDHRFGPLPIDNRTASDWPTFWGQRRLLKVSRELDRRWWKRVELLVARLADLVPTAPAAALLHGDLWSGNLLVRKSRLAAMIDPACYHGHAEVDLAMLTLFDAPGPGFWESYGPLEPGWRERRDCYQLFPALVHLRLFGDGYAAMVDRLLRSAGV